MDLDNKKPLNWEQLEQDFKNGQSIVLFLGTGVNFSKVKDFSWDALINHLLQYAISSIIHNGEEDSEDILLGSASKLIKELDSKVLGEKEYNKLKKQIRTDSVLSREVKTTIVKQKLGNEMYVSLIRDFLYSSTSKANLSKSVDSFIKDGKSEEFNSLLCVADLILRNENIRAVVTQNYDQFLNDVLEIMSGKKKEYRKLIPNIVCDWKNESKFKNDQFNIYHVHGFIPRYDEIQAPKDNKIVLSMDEFYEDSQNVYSWQIASQLHFLSQYTCIFCGLSLDDYTNQRLFHYVKGKHHGNFYYLTASTNEEGRINDRIKNEFHERNGLTVLYDENGFNNLYNLLKDLQYEHKEK